MRQSLRYASWLLLLFYTALLLTPGDGGSYGTASHPAGRSTVAKVQPATGFHKHHFSGMLIVRQMPDNEIRILGSTYFGLSLFDFSCTATPS